MTDYIDNEGTAHRHHHDDTSRSPALIEKFVIRLPKGLRNKIKHLSEKNRRSMNSEIIMVLEKHIQQNLLSQSATMDDFSDGTARYSYISDKELNRRLENLPAEKKEALLELLGK